MTLPGPIKQFGYTYELTVNDLKITALDIVFAVFRSLSKLPNTCDISVFNLSEENRKALGTFRKQTKKEKAGGASGKAVGDILVNLQAGYGGQNSLIYAGDLRTADSSHDGPDIETKLSTSDGLKKSVAASVHQSFKGGTTIDAVIKACAKAMGIGVGNLASVTNTEFPKGAGVFPSGTVISGNAAKELSGLLRSVGWEYSIQNGALQIVKRGDSLSKTALLITPETGLLGTPSLATDGILKFTSTMLPDLYPGRRVQVKTGAVDGIFRANNCRYTGDTAGGTWQIEVEAEPLVPKAA